MDIRTKNKRSCKCFGSYKCVNHALRDATIRKEEILNAIPNTSMDERRKAFEKWALDSGIVEEPQLGFRYVNGAYYSTVVNILWAAWQACCTNITKRIEILPTSSFQGDRDNLYLNRDAVLEKL